MRTRTERSTPNERRAEARRSRSDESEGGAERNNRSAPAETALETICYEFCNLIIQIRLILQRIVNMRAIMQDIKFFFTV